MSLFPKKVSGVLFFLLLLQITYVKGQKAWFVRDTSTILREKGLTLPLAWTGGLNAAQYNKMDLNGDQVDDLVIFDRTDSKISTFLARQKPDSSWYWHYAPEFEDRFPQVDNWIVLADYNQDGRQDLFASTSLGVQVYRFDQKDDVWQWTLASDALYTRGFSGFINLWVSGSDIPAIVDLDDDGDLDILAFDFSGTFIVLHQNMSMERFGVPDSLGNIQNPVFIRNGDCWGGFSKNSAQQYELGLDCNVVENPDNGRILHSGNSILAADLNDDGKKDLLVGHISSPQLGVFYNGSEGINAGFISYTEDYPAQDPVSMHIFPSAYLHDLDFDGIKDLIVTPNLPSGDAGLSDFTESNWFYHNAGTDTKVELQLQTKSFLQQQMLDVGENAAPAFIDMDGDGDMDMVVGTGAIAGLTTPRELYGTWKMSAPARIPSLRYVQKIILIYHR